MIAHVAEGDAEDVNRAVSAARKAFDEGPWPKMTAYVTIPYFTCYLIVLRWKVNGYKIKFSFQMSVQERSRVLFRFADLIEKHNDELAALETWDNGKPFEQSAKIEIPMLARFFRYYAGMPIFHDTTAPLCFLAFQQNLLSDVVDIPQDMRIKFMVSLFQPMESIMCKPCMNL